MSATRALVALLALVGCGPSGTCIDAPTYRTACEGVTIPIVLHYASDSLVDLERTDLLVSTADEVLGEHGIHVEVVAHEEGYYWPVIQDDGCDALHTWDDGRPRDGRLHVYLMDVIYEMPGSWYEGVTSDGMIALSWRAKPLILAHEIGHVLGERHVDDPGNLMFPGDHPGAASLDDDQGARMLRRACELYPPGA